MLQRLYFAFPDGLPGVVLLLLRAVIGLAVLVEGTFYFRENDPTLTMWLTGLTVLAAATLLCVGFLTPIAASLVLVCGSSIALSLLPASTSTLFVAKMSILFGATMLLNVIVLGPGAFSVDARLFGRREIIIPPPVLRSEEERQKKGRLRPGEAER